MYICRVTDVYGGSQTVIDDDHDPLRREQLIVKRRFERDHDDYDDNDNNDDYILFSILLT